MAKIWNHQADARLLLHILKVHDKINFAAVAASMGEGTTAGSIQVHIFCLKKDKGPVGGKAAAECIQSATPSPEKKRRRGGKDKGKGEGEGEGKGGDSRKRKNTADDTTGGFEFRGAVDNIGEDLIVGTPTDLHEDGAGKRMKVAGD